MTPRQDARQPRKSKICTECGETWTTKPHSRHVDCLLALKRRNARDREYHRGTVLSLTAVIHQNTREVDRLAQRVEMLAVATERSEQ